MRKLRALAENGVDGLKPIAPAPDASPRLYRIPTVPRLAVFGLRCAARLAAAQFRYRLFDDQWFLAIARRTTCGPDGGPVPSHGPFQTLAMPRSRFYADPCAVSVKGQDFIFFEDYSFREKRGRISCATMDSSGQIVNLGAVLEEPFHLSYPFVFELDGDYFMIPESAAANSVRLYQATTFPTRWQLETTLFPSIKAVDSTLHRSDDGMLWLFTNTPQPGASNQDELHLFYATALQGPWKPHGQNPIVSDVRRARPSGRLFRRNGMLIRPAQNSSVRYGGSIVLNVVNELSPESCKETRLEGIGPEWLENSIATHTLSITDRLVVTDGLRTRWKSGRA